MWGAKEEVTNIDNTFLFYCYATENGPKRHIFANLGQTWPSYRTLSNIAHCHLLHTFTYCTPLPITHCHLLHTVIYYKLSNIAH